MYFKWVDSKIVSHCFIFISLIIRKVRHFFYLLKRLFIMFLFCELPPCIICLFLSFSPPIFFFFYWFYDLHSLDISLLSVCCKSCLWVACVFTLYNLSLIREVFSPRSLYLWFEHIVLFLWNHSLSPVS